MSKKANLTDAGNYLEAAMVLAIVIGIVLAFGHQFNANVQASDNSTIPGIVKDASNSYYSYLPYAYDLAFLGMFLGFVLFSVVAARYIPSGPEYTVIAVLYLLAVPFIAHFIIGNFWHDFAANATINTAISSMKFMPFMMNHLIYFALFYVTIVAIALYSKRGAPQ